jgi:tyrosinase
MADIVIANPTYIENVRHFFEDVDLDHMFHWGYDLTTYPTLKANAQAVIDQTRPPDGAMPPEPERKWSQERFQSFRKWVDNGFPLGTVTPLRVQPPAPAERMRKDARDLSDEDQQTLARAFQGLMDREPDDPTSYFAIAGQHWFPNIHCHHHDDRFFPWHRAYIRTFEDALRSVPGCADVTLPYWDITDAPPDFLYSAPFDSYTLPRDIHINEDDPDRSYPAGYRTSRFAAKAIKDNVAFRRIPEGITAALAMFSWGDFALANSTGIEWDPHDAGHVATGKTMTHPDAASFDPIFWFFHANWDRLWWQWQLAMQAATRWSFRSTVTSGLTGFLQAPDNNVLEGTGDYKRAELQLDLAASGVGYALPHDAAPVVTEAAPAMFGSAVASRRMKVGTGPVVSVRVKGINRLPIPGSFDLVLKADGEPIGRRPFFQSTEPLECGACRERGVIDLDFRVGADAVVGRVLTVEIELLAPGAERIGRRFPLRAAGDPTINARLLLQDSE